MLDVFFTVDVEIWCDGWDDLDTRFPAAYRRYIYGPTREGDYALPVTLKILNDHGLTGVFFVEPLFATRFGLEPLQEVIGLIKAAGHEVQLHLHTEWVDESLQPLLPEVSGKRQYLRDFSRAEQVKLIAAGLELLRRAGAGSVNAFRAGNFGLNYDTLFALAENAIEFDSSYNPASRVFANDVTPGRILTHPAVFEGVVEYPVTVFRDRGPSSLRPLHLTACSFNEFIGVLNTAADSDWSCVVIVSHNFELLNQRKDRPDPIVVKRFAQLCRYLEQNGDRFRVRGFRGLEFVEKRAQPEPPRSSMWLTCERFGQQLARRAYG